jgi:hypothetical protein
MFLPGLTFQTAWDDPGHRLVAVAFNERSTRLLVVIA